MVVVMAVRIPPRATFAKSITAGREVGSKYPKPNTKTTTEDSKMHKSLSNSRDIIVIQQRN
jgi:hypothetical protein